MYVISVAHFLFTTALNRHITIVYIKLFHHKNILLQIAMSELRTPGSYLNLSLFFSFKNIL